MKIRKQLVSVLGTVSIVLLPCLAGADGGKIYEVTITNLTAGQPLTPPILVTHSRRTGIFTLGDEASAEIQAIAENGNGAPLVAALEADPHVHSIVQGGAPLVPANDPGATGFGFSETYTIDAGGNTRFLSFTSMLICTNDGFTGLDTVALPNRTRTVFARSYDARTEINTEDFADMVPPCQGLIGVTSGEPGTGMTDSALAEDGIVIPHAGIVGGSDLVAGVHGWNDPVVRIDIVRVRHGNHGDDD